ncbi:NADH-quinone oxidoreductase subunit B family protein [Metallosphaera tengchongensis]|uniref:NADH-quinone oxidoreductase subunit B family protein n=1 Tax=Metallosphaera tengchongensis TaxID=1532350 RepID=UPI003CCD7881
MNWFLRGIKKGVVTEKRFPEVLWPSTLEWREKGEVKCPTGAISGGEWYPNKCVFCRHCETALSPTGKPLGFKVEKEEPTFKKSFYLYPIDVGTCGGCNVELRLISSPQYDMTRFGIFFTNTPRHADALVVMGVLSPRMEEVLRRAYDAMPEPKLIILLGVCALSGGVMGVPPDVRGDVLIPGCPPTPESILRALVKAKGGEGI